VTQVFRSILSTASILVVALSPQLSYADSEMPADIAAQFGDDPYGLASETEAKGEGAFVRGVVRAAREASISTDINREIVSLPLREGDVFRKGDVLVRFDCGELEADLAAAAARLQAETLKAANDRHLTKLKAVGQFDLKIQEARVSQSEAEHRGLKERTDRCTIRAPYDGRIAGVVANEFEFPTAGNPMMRIIGRTAPKIELILPAKWLRWLGTGTAFTLNIEETGRDHAAKIKSIAPVVDAVSQTVKVVAEFSGETGGVLPGMSGPANFSAPE
jgi:RND family efflux transporter MFP subunit